MAIVLHSKYYQAMTHPTDELVPTPEPSWSGSTRAVWPQVDLPTALHTKYPTDAHIALYSVPGRASIPRLSKGILAHMPPSEAPVLRHVFVDLDNPGHLPWSQAPDGPPGFHDFLESNTPLAISAGWYRTAHGARLMWNLRDPVPAHMFRSLVVPLMETLQSLGLEPDFACKDWTRLFRLPYVVRSQHSSTVSDTPLALPRGYLDTVWFPRDGLCPEHVAPSGHSDNSPRPSEPRPLTPTERQTLERVLDGELAHTLLQGQILAHPGERHTRTLSVLGALANALDTSDPEILYGALFPSYQAMVEAYPDSSGLGKAWNLCQWVSAQYRAERASQVQDVDLGLEKAVAQAMGVPLGKVRENLVLYTPDGQGLYVWSLREMEYRHSVAPALLVPTLEKYCGALNPTTRSSAGGPRSLTAILADHGSEIWSAEYRYGAIRNEVLDGTLVLKTCREDRALSAEWSSDVHKWLEAAFPDKTDLEHVLDWLATSTELTEPTCALYLEGPPAVGKSLFAVGLARIWGVGPVEYDLATSRFNDALLRSPVILADEPPPGLGNESSTTVRRLLNGVGLTIEAKFRPTIPLTGCPRLIIAANNGDALALNETLTASDIAAIQERIGHVVMSEEGSRFLEAIGGRDHVHRTWIEQGVFAKHVLWLRDNRRPVRGRRFLVSGWQSSLTDNLASAVRVNQALCLVLAQALKASTPFPGVWAEDDEIFVQASLVPTLWKAFGHDRPPTQPTILTAIKALSSGPPLRMTLGGERRRVWPILPHHVAIVAERYGIGEYSEFA